MLLVIGGNRGGLGDLVVQMTRELGKPLAMAVTRPLELAGEEYRLLLEGGVATYPDGRRAAKALAWVAQYRDYVEATKGG
jgi:acyl-CoA synthetase (NDP forming)